MYAAVKIVPFSRFSPSPRLAASNDTLSDLERELAVMKLISHPNILALYDVWENQRETYVNVWARPRIFYALTKPFK
jgi:serine/threonine protein kinase